MTYFCYVQSLNSAVPHMEPLEAAGPKDAEREAARLLLRHSSGFVAHVFNDAELVVTVYGRLPLRLAGDVR